MSKIMQVSSIPKVIHCPDTGDFQMGQYSKVHYTWQRAKDLCKVYTKYAMRLSNWTGRQIVFYNPEDDSFYMESERNAPIKYSFQQLDVLRNDWIVFEM